jgi:hypothetical protein
MNLIDVMGLGTVALRGICRLNVRFGSLDALQPKPYRQHPELTRAMKRFRIDLINKRFNVPGYLCGQLKQIARRDFMLL